MIWFTPEPLVDDRAKEGSSRFEGSNTRLRILPQWFRKKLITLWAQPSTGGARTCERSGSVHRLSPGQSFLGMVLTDTKRSSTMIH